jgi:hypothetical protein
MRGRSILNYTATEALIRNEGDAGLMVKGKVERPYRYIREDFFLAPIFTAFLTRLESGSSKCIPCQ